MAFHVLNCSVDAPDAMPESVAEDLSYNDIESVIELVVEQVLGYENAIAEYDDNDTDSNGGLEIKKSLSYFILPLPPLQIRPKNTVPGENIAVIWEVDGYYDQFNHTPVVPPPQS
jgi:hypothetical protein